MHASTCRCLRQCNNSSMHIHLLYTAAISDECLPLPITPVVVGHDHEWLSVSPLSLPSWVSQIYDIELLARISPVITFSYWLTNIVQLLLYMYRISFCLSHMPCVRMWPTLYWCHPLTFHLLHPPSLRHLRTTSETSPSCLRSVAYWIS